jgi:hypothetical protein
MGTSKVIHVVSTVMRAQVIVLVTVVALSASCTGTLDGASTSSPSAGAVSPGSEASPSAQPIIDYVSFARGLAAVGFKVREGDRTGSELFSVPGQTVFIDGVRVSTYEYPSEATLNEERSGISRDGYSVPTGTGGVAIVEWVAAPHFYAGGKLLVLYVGDKQRILEGLDLLLGPQFAGG